MQAFVDAMRENTSLVRLNLAWRQQPNRIKIDEFLRRNYDGGEDCEQASALQDPLEMLLRSRSDPTFRYVAVEIADSSEEESEDDYEYQP